MAELMRRGLSLFGMLLALTWGATAHAFTAQRQAASNPAVCANVTVKIDFAANDGAGLYCLNGTRYSSFLAMPGANFTRASAKICVTVAGALVTVGPNIPCITDQGALIEQSATNFALNSGSLSGYGVSNATLTMDGTLAPDGSSLALKALATANFAVVQYPITGAGSASGNTYSIFVKQGSGPTDANSYFLRDNTTSVNLVSGTLNFSTLAWTAVTGSAPVVTRLANGWLRIALSATSGVSSGDALSIYAGLSGSSGTTGQYSYAWGAQLEAGSFATSYIATTSSTATRAADVASIGGLSTLANFTLFAEGSRITNGNFAAHASLNDGTLNNEAYVVSADPSNSGTWAEGYVRSGGAGAVGGFIGNSAINANIKMALSVTPNAFLGSAGGAAPTAYTPTGGVPFTTLNLGTRSGGANPINGLLRRVFVAPSNLSAEGITQ